MTKNDLVKAIEKLKKERRAILLAHNYQNPDVQDVADFRGDSLELSRIAAKTDASVIVFCGVHFMAETAAILNPDKIVLLPRKDAGCPMADMITADDLQRVKEEYPGVPIITYVNSTADVKALSTICCTSANVVKIVRSFQDHPRVYLTPDKNLAQYAAKHVNNEVLYWDGFCPIHDSLSVHEVIAKKKQFPEALFIAHPECRPEVLDVADHIFSTSGMLRFVKEAGNREFIIGTEVGIIYPMQRENPDKIFYPASESMICSNMKKISLMDVFNALETLEPRVVVSENIRTKALAAITRMLEVS